MTTTLQEAASRISQIIQERPGQTMPGSMLALALRLSLPDFAPYQFGALNFRDFIRKHVPSVREIGKAGEDIIYGRKDPEPCSAETPAVSGPAAQRAPDPVLLSVDIPIWKTYASPLTLHRLFGNTETGDLRVVAPGEVAPSLPWVNIPPCAAEVHLRIANEYLQTIQDEGLRKALGAALTGPRWWTGFFLMANQLGLASSWYEFRRRRILTELTNTLQELSVPFKGPKLTIGPRPRAQSEVPVSLSARARPMDEELIRQLALAAVKRMSVEELRTLSLPLGYVADEIRNIG